MPRKRPLDPTIAYAERLLKKEYLPHILSCLKQLSVEQIWWRPNEACNSVGNLVLHLTGNVRQWIISGLGGAPDHRQRDVEFSERRNLQRDVLTERLEVAVLEACRVLRGAAPADLKRGYSIQKFRVTGLEAAFHVTEHFSHHTGQIIWITKMLTGGDLKFTHLPGDKKKKKRK